MTLIDKLASELGKSVNTLRSRLQVIRDSDCDIDQPINYGLLALDAFLTRFVSPAQALLIVRTFIHEIVNVYTANADSHNPAVFLDLIDSRWVKISSRDDFYCMLAGKFTKTITAVPLTVFRIDLQKLYSVCREKCEGFGTDEDAARVDDVLQKPDQ